MAKVRESITSNCEKKFVNKLLNLYQRLDGRAFDEFREVQIQFSKDWGCCCVSLGATRVLAQVSCEIQQPKSSRPSEGILNINVELSPLAAPHFEAGRQSELSVQLNRILEKCIKDSKAIDLESLCIKVSEKVWAFRLDINVLNHEGNLADCASIAALTALAHFRRPDISTDGEEIVIHTYAERDPIPTVIHHYPICISFAIFNEGATVVIDPTLLEEGVADAQLVVGLNAYKELCGLHLGGSAFMLPEDIVRCTSRAAVKASTIIQQIKDSIKEDEEKRSQNTAIGFEKTFQLRKSAGISDKNLSACLDTWSTVSYKKENRSKIKKENMETDESQLTEAETATIESLGKGTAVFLPSKNGDNGQWTVSSDESSEEDTNGNQQGGDIKPKVKKRKI